MLEKFFQARTSLIIICVTIALLPFAITSFCGVTFANNPLTTLRVLVLSAGVLLAALSWVGAVIKKEVSIKLGSALYLLLALFLLIVLSSIFAISPIEAIFGGFDNPIGLLSYLCLLALTFLATQLIRGRDDLILLSKTIVFSMLVPALIAFASRIIGYDPISNLSLFDAGENAYLITRGVGTFGNPDFLGHTLVLPSILALGFFASAKEIKSRLIYGLSFFALSSNLIISATRGAILAFLVGAAFFLIVLAVKRAGALKSSALVLGSIIIALAIAIPISAKVHDPILPRLFGSAPAEVVTQTTEGQSTLQNLGGRTIFWKDIPKMVKAKPLFGAGPANYMNAWHLKRSKASLAVGAQATMTDAHNLILDMAVNLGLPATIVAIALALWVLIPQLIQSFKLQAHEGRLKIGSGLFLAWSAGLLALLVSSITAMTTLTWFVYLFLSLGVLYAPKVKIIKTSQEQIGAKRMSLALISSASILLFAPLIWSLIWLGSNITYASAPEAQYPLDRALQATSRAPFDIYQKSLVARLHVAAATSNTNVNPNAQAALINKAIKLYEEVDRIAPASYEHFEGMAVAYFHLSDIEGDLSFLSKGLEAAEKGLELYPAALALRTVSAEALNDAGRFEDAYKVLDGWAGLDPNLEESQTQFERAKRGLAP